MSAYYDVNFNPFVSVIVEEKDDGTCQVVGVEVDWSDSFQNAWRLNRDTLAATTEVVEDGANEHDHPAAAFGVEFMDSIVAGRRYPELCWNHEALEILADKMEAWPALREKLLPSTA